MYGTLLNFSPINFLHLRHVSKHLIRSFKLKNCLNIISKISGGWYSIFLAKIMKSKYNQPSQNYSWVHLSLLLIHLSVGCGFGGKTLWRTCRICLKFQNANQIGNMSYFTNKCLLWFKIFSTPFEQFFGDHVFNFLQ